MTSTNQLPKFTTQIGSTVARHLRGHSYIDIMAWDGVFVEQELVYNMQNGAPTEILSVMGQSTIFIHLDTIFSREANPQKFYIFVVEDATYDLIAFIPKELTHIPMEKVWVKNAKRRLDYENTKIYYQDHPKEEKE